jgi:protein-disulfide isomerase
MASKLRLIGLILAVVLAGYAVGLAIDWLRVPGIALDETPALQELRKGEGAPSSGPRDAAVTVVVITDYQCAVCRLDQPGLAELVGTEPEARFVFKEWAILGPPSREAARVALASAYQGHYQAVRDALMRTLPPLTPERVRQAAISAGADGERLDRDLARHRAAIDAELARTSRQAFGLGLPGTPAYLVGNRLVIGRLTESKLRQLIAQAS